jgi:predicted PhzF superfamily epimerase YddE/YHI9
VGIAESPATRTDGGPLAAFLVHHGSASGPGGIVERGLATGRPSRLEIRAAGARVEPRARQS